MGVTLPGGTDGPFYDDLAVGDVFDSAPAIRLTDGLAAMHHAILGGRLRLAFDADLATRVTSTPTPFAAPAFVWDIAIGQSTLVTQRAIANLFYRGLVFLHAPTIGDTLKTRTSIIGLRPVTPKPGKSPRGLAVMRIETTDQTGRAVLDFQRCAMLPAHVEDTKGPQGIIDPPPPDMSAAHVSAMTRHWDLSAFRLAAVGPHFADLTEGATYRIAGGDLVSSAPELARLTMNLAAIHHDRTITGQRLVYGGHTIGLAMAQLTRALPSLVTILAWHGCDHTGPVHEGDTLHAELTIERLEALPQGGLAHMRSLVRATDVDGNQSDVLDWRMIGLFA